MSGRYVWDRRDAEVEPERPARAAGAVTNPEGTAKLHEYWAHGPGAAKIKWGVPGDFNRCVLHLGKYVRDPKGLCANLHHAALGVWPGQEHKKGRSMADSKPYGNVTYADPGYQSDGVARYPLDSAAHCKSAWSYINMPKNAGKYTSSQLSAIKGRIKGAAKKYGIEISEGNSAPVDGEYRTVPFDVASTEATGDGLTFEGYAAVYDTPTRISGWDEDFDEQITPGAFRAVAAGKYPVLMFDHGKHPLIGSMPLGRITSAREDPAGLYITARLTDNWLIQPVRDAVADRALTGMSFRFMVDDDGESWDRTRDIPLRTLTSVSVPELGPVVFPAYEPTTASVRSILDKFDELPVIGRPPAGAMAATDREDDTPANEAPSPLLSARFHRDGEALAIRGIQGVKI